MKIEYTVIKGKSWDYITFPEHSPLAHIFFINYHFTLTESETFTQHKNKCNKIPSVYLEGNEKVKELLSVCGFSHSKKINDPYYGLVDQFFTPTGDIVIVSMSNVKSRPRINRILFQGSNGSINLKLP